MSTDNQYPPFEHRIGRLGRDPETKTFGDTEVVTFSLAVKKNYDRDGDNTQWVDVSVKSPRLKEQALRLRKGMIVGVEGNSKSKPRDGGGEFVNFYAMGLYRLEDDQAVARTPQRGGLDDI